MTDVTLRGTEDGERQTFECRLCGRHRIRDKADVLRFGPPVCRNGEHEITMMTPI
jgi:hypothetical protein